MSTEVTEDSNTYCLFPVHALVEVLKLQLALLHGADLSDAMGTLDPLLLKGMAACRPLVRLSSTLQQQPAVQADAKPRVRVYERHDAEGGGAGEDGGEETMMDKTG